MTEGILIERSPVARKLSCTTVGAWRLTQQPRKEGAHRVNRHLSVRMPSYIATVLQEKRDGVWKDWMTDDPIYYGAMQAYAQKAHGNVLVVGLGMGIVLHHLADNKAVKHVVVVERQPEVIEMVWPSIDHGLCELWQGDFFDVAPQLHMPFDTVIADPWVGSPLDEDFQQLFLDVFDIVRTRWPAAQGFYHGVDPWARELIAREGMETDRMALLRGMAEQWV